MVSAITQLSEPIAGYQNRKGHTFESCRVRQILFILQRDMLA